MNGKAAKTIENKRMIMDYLTLNGESKANDIAQYIELSGARTRVLLSELIEEGNVEPKGNGRSRKYCLAE